MYSLIMWEGFRPMSGEMWFVAFLGSNLSCPTSYHASGHPWYHSQDCTFLDVDFGTLHGDVLENLQLHSAELVK